MKKRKTKRKTKQQKVIDKTFEHVFSLLTTAQQIIGKPAEFRYPIHHMLLDLIPTTETILNANGFSRTGEVIKRIKEVAEMVAPSDDVVAYQ